MSDFGRTRGASSRTQVTYLGRQVPGLFVRRTARGEHVYELCAKRRGKVVRRKLMSQTVSDAVRELRVEIAKLDADERPFARGDLTLLQLVAWWCEWATSPASPYAARTVEYDRRAYRHVLRILGADTEAASVKPAHLRLLIDRLCQEGFAGATVHGTLTALSALFRFAVRRGALAVNPVRLLERGERPSTRRLREPRYLSRAEIDRLLAELSDEFRPICATLAFAGLRVSEALTLAWADVDFAKRELFVRGTKTQASRAKVPMADVLAAELRAHRARRPGVGDSLVFATPNGTQRDRHNVSRALRAAGDAAKLNPPGAKKIAPHDLRHSCAALLLAAGLPAPKVAAVMRHADARVTLMVYGGLVESQRSELRADLEAAFQ